MASGTAWYSHEPPKHAAQVTPKTDTPTVLSQLPRARRRRITVAGSDRTSQAKWVHALTGSRKSSHVIVVFSGSVWADASPASDSFYGDRVATGVPRSRGSRPSAGDSNLHHRPPTAPDHPISIS